MSWRRLGVLIRHLPNESATARAQVGEAGRWSDTEYLLALVADGIAAGNWQRAVIAGAKPKPRPPKPIPRPGVVDGTRLGRTSLTPDEVKAFLHRFDPPPDDEQEDTDGN